jgi:transposase
MKRPKYFVGIDLHKTIVQICVLEGVDRITLEQRFEIKTVEQGLAVVDSLKRWRRGGRFAVEAVGFNRWFVDACREAGLEIVVADPAKLGLKALGKKTDRRDAYEIARRLCLGDIDKNALTYYPTTEEYGLRKVLRTRHKLVKMRQQAVNQIRGLINAYKLNAPRGELYRPVNLSRLRSCECPNEDLALVLNQLLSTLESIQESVTALTKRIEQCAQENRQTQAMLDLPQFGPQTAVTIVYELGDVQRFRNARAAAASAGLVPRVFATAHTVHHGRLTKRGSPELRWILCEWAVRLMAFDPLAAAWAQERLKKSKNKNKVRVALARRLLVGIYFMLRTGESFSLKKCLGA